MASTKYSTLMGPTEITTVREAFTSEEYVGYSHEALVLVNAKSTAAGPVLNNLGFQTKGPDGLWYDGEDIETTAVSITTEGIQEAFPLTNFGETIRISYQINGVDDAKVVTLSIHLIHKT